MSSRLLLPIVLLSMCLIALMPHVTLSQDCDEVLRHGILNQTTIEQNDNTRMTFNQWLYDMDFQTHDQAINAGLSIGTIVYGVPLQVGGTFTQQQKDTWRHEHQEYRNDTLTTTHKYLLLQSTISPDVLAAWNKCQATNSVFGSVLDATGLDVATLDVIWQPLEGDTGANPVVTSSEIAGGVRASDGKSIAFDAQYGLKRGHNRQIIKRVHGQPLIIVVQTTRGDLADSLSAVIDQPEIIEFSASPQTIIRGNPVVLKWNSSNASQVSIDNGIGTVGSKGSCVVTPGSSVTYTLTASNPGGTVRRGVDVTVKPPQLTEMSVHFDVGNDDKDDDTQISVVVSKAGRQLAEWHQTNNECWHDWQHITKPLTVAANVTPEDIGGATLIVTITPNGNDTFRFSLSLTGKFNGSASGGSTSATASTNLLGIFFAFGEFSAGSNYNYNGGAHELSQDNRTLTLTLPAP
jgi:hypothetical protein